MNLSSNEQEIQYQKLWEEENQKNKELSEKISRLQKIEHGECSLCIMHEETGNDQENSHENTPCEGTPGKTLRKLTKKRKSMNTKEGAATPYLDLRFDRAADKHVYGNEDSGVPSSIQQPLCCQRKIYSSGGDSNDTSSVNCVFQYLIEFLVGMKISPLAPSNELCILAHHQSSGYSFTLTWITNSRGETELIYRVLSLGTFERVAPEWMKETLMFSTSMCSIFFDRVSRVIKS
ncbi:hypothetical protein ACJIZ3_020995 [Penstemon smallii]|uniref:DUF7806 domain-containing protein n=1 Tax=Penstemon smallii TaxID=265156 RepID=A0ABD3SKP7_9LAMI